MTRIERQTLYHVTVLSNFARGFDKYERTYSKAGIPESTFPDRFFLLRREELSIGVEKATRLADRLALPGNRLIVFETEVANLELHPNTASGRGTYVLSDRILLNAVHEVGAISRGAVELRAWTTEEAMAESLRILNPSLVPFAKIRPRAISFLPIALACQAKCPFCFSKASVSIDQKPSRPDWEAIQNWLASALARGAERAVITGGGEPTLLPSAMLDKLIAACSKQFDKVVLITNGRVFSESPAVRQEERLKEVYAAGLKVIAISRHHFDSNRSRQLMQLEVHLESLINSWREHGDRWPNLRLRLICVLQEGGVEDDATLAGYLTWAADRGIEEICFKELYVSTSGESVYYDRAANDWSRSHQVPLSLVTRFAAQHGFKVESRLPWGAPVYTGEWRGRKLRVAAYSEPSLFWERSHGMARSWNVMADGRCHVSLEDRSSEIKLEEVA